MRWFIVPGFWFLAARQARLAAKNQKREAKTKIFPPALLASF
jgi:hypothetical protein